MRPEDIRARVARSASVLTAGGFRPSGEITESWLGRAFLYAPTESLPRDSAGNDMLPLAQLYLPGLPFVPASLDGLALITTFIGRAFPGEFEPMGARWLVREYTSIDGLVAKDLTPEHGFLKPFPVSSALFDDDWPMWDSGGLAMEVSDAILKMEDEGTITSYDDLANHNYSHKVGGYPSFCQPGIDPDEGYDFAFQVSSDEKINLNVVDNGSFQFYRNPQTKQWQIYYDFS